MTGLRLHFRGFDSFPDGQGVWDLQIDTPRVGFVVAPSLADAMKRVEEITGRTDWALADSPPRPVRAVKRVVGPMEELNEEDE